MTLKIRQIDERDFPAAGSLEEKARFLLQYAVLAPSFHNSQPWRFAVRGAIVELWADPGRWLRVADRDQRELHLSLGCALENLLVAAEHYGLGHRVEYVPEPDRSGLAVRITLAADGAPSPARPNELFQAIESRYTNRGLYDPDPLPADALARLRTACHDDGVRLVLTSDPEPKAWVERFVAEADGEQLADPEFRDELTRWMGQGAFGAPGTSEESGRLLLDRFDLARAVGEKDARALSSAPVFGLIVTLDDDRTSQVKAGQAFERLALTAESLGLAVQPVSQLLELDATKAALGEVLGLGAGVPQQPFRLGYGPPAAAATPRRPVEEVLATR